MPENLLKAAEQQAIERIKEICVSEDMVQNHINADDTVAILLNSIRMTELARIFRRVALHGRHPK